jgi:hypothetical protein
MANQGDAQGEEMQNQDASGCFFLLSNEPVVGSAVEIEITLPEELGGPGVGKFVCQGKIIQVEKKRENGRTGVFCSIEEYRLIPEGSANEEKQEV